MVGLHDAAGRLLRVTSVGWSRYFGRSRECDCATRDADVRLDWRGIPIRDGQVSSYLIAARSVM